MDIIVIYCTVPSKKLAKDITRVLMKHKLAACVTMVDNVKSVFSWDGEPVREHGGDGDSQKAPQQGRRAGHVLYAHVVRSGGGHRGGERRAPGSLRGKGIFDLPPRHDGEPEADGRIHSRCRPACACVLRPGVRYPRRGGHGKLCRRRGGVTTCLSARPLDTKKGNSVKYALLAGDVPSGENEKNMTKAKHSDRRKASAPGRVCDLEGLRASYSSSSSPHATTRSTCSTCSTRTKATAKASGTTG